VTAAGRILRLFSCALAVLAVSATSAAAAPNREPQPHADGADAGASPLDLRAVTFGQRGTQLVLRIVTAGEWDPAELAAPGRALCIDLFYGSLPSPRSRVCVFGDAAGEAALSYTRLDPFGNSVSAGFLPAAVSRADKRSVEAVFNPSAVNLGLGRYSWQALSTWSCEPAAGCDDRSPDTGNVIAQISPLAEPPCFGAASRNPRFRCVNPELRLSVVPTPDEALLTANAPCNIVSRTLPYTCEFGVTAPAAERTVALIGDSHATHWRAALEVVAQARSWRGYSLTRPGCPLSLATPDIDRARRVSCTRWRKAVFAWFGRHPKVRTVFVSQLAGVGVRAPRGRNHDEHNIQGFIRAWRRLPRTVREIIVLRDTPVARETTPDCVTRAIRRKRPAGPACAIPRRLAIRRDHAAIAAVRRGTARVHLIDFTRFMCSPKLCYPVVGGVLVHKDITHLTPLFASTLGPFLLSSVNRMYGSKSARR
jgi:hypothetical protein